MKDLPFDGFVHTPSGPVNALHWTKPYNVVCNLATRIKQQNRAFVSGVAWVATDHDHAPYEYIEVIWDLCPNCKCGSKQPMSMYAGVYGCDNCKHMWDLSNPNEALVHGTFRPFNFNTVKTKDL
jgi:hypothetical protein